MLVVNCTSEENSASSYGGTIYLRTGGRLEVRDSIMKSPTGDVGSMLDGGLIGSCGPRLTLTRVQFAVQTLSMLVPAVSHGSDANSESLFISNISIQCPVNAMLLASNISLEIFKKVSIKLTSISRM